MSYLESEENVSPSKNALQGCPFYVFLFCRRWLRWGQRIPYTDCGDEDARDLY